MRGSILVCRVSKWSRTSLTFTLRTVNCRSISCARLPKKLASRNSLIISSTASHSPTMSQLVKINSTRWWKCTKMRFLSTLSKKLTRLISLLFKLPQKFYPVVTQTWFRHAATIWMKNTSSLKFRFKKFYKFSLSRASISQHKKAKSFFKACF